KYSTYYSAIGSDFSDFKKIYSYGWESDYLYRAWNFLIANLGLSVKEFIWLTAFVSILLFLVSLRKLFPREYLLVFLFFYATPAFISLFGNAIRQGLATPFFLLSIYYFFRKKKY